MKKIYLTLLAIVAFAGIKAASYTVTIVGTSYAPNTLSVNVGDVVTIQATGNHPLQQVDQSTWAANGTTPMTGGFGPVTSNHTFTVGSASTIYYVCTAHASMGMKGQIVAAATTGLSQHVASLTQLSVYPNPVKEQLNAQVNVATSVSASVKLYSITGQMVAVLAESTELTAGENKMSFNVPASLAAGNYIMEIVAGTDKVSKQILIAK